MCCRNKIHVEVLRVFSHLVQDVIAPAAVREFQQLKHALSALGEHGVPAALAGGAERFTVHLRTQV